MNCANKGSFFSENSVLSVREKGWFGSNMIVAVPIEVCWSSLSTAYWRHLEKVLL